MAQEDRQIGIGEHVARDAPEDQTASRMVHVGSQDQHIGAELMRLGQECFPEHARPDREHMQFGADAVLGETSGMGGGGEPSRVPART